MSRKAYPSDVSDEEWHFAAPYLALMTPDAPQRQHDLREVFSALRWMVRSGSPWRYLPGDFPRWEVVYQQTQRWFTAGCFEAMAHDLRLALRVLNQREPVPSAAIYDSRTLSSTPESGARAGYNGHKKTKGSKVHIAVDTLGHLLTLKVTAANEDDRTQVEALSEELQEATGESVEIAYVDQGYSGDNAAEQAQRQGIELIVVKLEEAKRGFVLLPRRWVVERSFAWATRFRRLVKDYERLPETVAGIHLLAFTCIMLKQCFSLIQLMQST
jgi:transposase